MQTTNISLPDQLQEFVDNQVASGRYGNASEYIEALVRDDEKRAAHENREALSRKGVGSGELIEMTPARIGTTSCATRYGTSSTAIRRVYRRGPTPAAGHFPVVVYFHQ